ncbi:hypothetical protein BV25DRAFT_1898090 [Artomyces pyxidatus]|uniref:Uncharacterized protein n=1 Tax=Artomyces pyxidatus TaxID=48021 RepID=A0ACB8T9I2_9AGAM|nr:hypothetical protein BV25DRAFT_1898090 [Artomyces pyxidatus]
MDILLTWSLGAYFSHLFTHSRDICDIFWLELAAITITLAASVIAVAFRNWRILRTAEYTDSNDWRSISPPYSSIALVPLYGSVQMNMPSVGTAVYDEMLSKIRRSRITVDHISHPLVNEEACPPPCLMHAKQTDGFLRKESSMGRSLEVHTAPRMKLEPQDSGRQNSE